MSSAELEYLDKIKRSAAAKSAAISNIEHIFKQYDREITRQYYDELSKYYNELQETLDNTQPDVAYDIIEHQGYTDVWDHNTKYIYLTDDEHEDVSYIILKSGDIRRRSKYPSYTETYIGNIKTMDPKEFRKITNVESKITRKKKMLEELLV